MTFATEFNQLKVRLFGDPNHSANISAEEIGGAEARLGHKVPVILRQYYRIVGRDHLISAVYNRLLNPENLRIAGDVLVFAEENQCVVRWGIPVDRLSGPDPPVVQGQSDEATHWYPESEPLSGFLKRFLYWQAVNGGLPYGGVAEITTIEAGKIEQVALRVDLGKPEAEEDMMIFEGESGRAVFCVLRGCGKILLYAGARNATSISHAEHVLGVKLL